MSTVPDSFDFSDIPSDDALDANTPLKEGSYHFVVESVDPDHASKKKGTRGVEFVLQVLAGTEDQKGKKLYERFYYPTADQTPEGRAFMLKRIGKIARTLSIMSAADLGKSNVVIPWKKAAARQLIALVSNSTDDNGKVNGSQIDGLKMFRVDDPEVAEVPKDKDVMAMLGGAGDGEAAAEPTKPATSIGDL